MMIYVAPITHVSPTVTIRREWRLPARGSIAVRVNEQLSAGETVAEAQVPERRVFLDVARALNVTEEAAGRYLTCKVGDHLSEGDRIAQIGGMLRRTVRAPGNGRVVTFSEGRILYELVGRTHELKSRYPCTVGGTDGIQSIYVETIGALIQGVWGNGKHDYGVLRLVSKKPNQKLSTDVVDPKWRGAVLIAGYCDQSAPLHQATELSARGLILGGLAAGLIPVVRRLHFPVVVLEGFGNVGINTAAFQLLKSNQGNEASIDAMPSKSYEAKKPEIIIPLASTREYDLPDEVVPLSPGVRVRVLRKPHMGAVGVVREVLTRAVRYPSGNKARSARLDIEGTGSVVVPLANLEVLQ
jgi:hypothetical protein